MLTGSSNMILLIRKMMVIIMKDELKELLRNVSPDRAADLRDFLWNEVIQKNKPTVSVQIGQIVKWKTKYNNAIHVGIALDNKKEVKSFEALYYMPDYHCLRVIRVDSDSYDLEITNEILDMSKLIHLTHILNDGYAQ